MKFRNCTKAATPVFGILCSHEEMLLAPEGERALKKIIKRALPEITGLKVDLLPGDKGKADVTWKDGATFDEVREVIEDRGARAGVLALANIETFITQFNLRCLSAAKVKAAA